MVSWGVVAMADEPAALLAAWAGYHLDLGACEVHLCLDRPNAEAQQILAAVPGVHLHLDGGDGWAFQNVGRRPQGQNARQKYHASRILAQTGADWLLHCDTDEFLFPTPLGESVEALLARVPEGMTSVQVAVAERVNVRGRPKPDIFSGVFRLPWERFGDEGYQVYDDLTLELLQRGICGHRMGKAMVRAGQGLFIGVHHGLRAFDGTVRDTAVAQGTGLRVLHFDGLTRLHYLLKMLRYGATDRLGNPASHARARWTQITAVNEEAHAEERLRLIWRAAKTISGAQAQALAERLLLRRWEPEIARRAARHVPGLPSLTPAAFDQALIMHETALIASLQARHGFDPQYLAET